MTQLTAKTALLANLDLQTKGTAACVLLVSLVNTANIVRIVSFRDYRLSFLFRLLLV